jgi:hypothetical protein
VRRGRLRMRAGQGDEGERERGEPGADHGAGSTAGRAAGIVPFGRLVRIGGR